MINIKYDDNKVKDDKIVNLAEAIKKIVSEETGIAEVFVYADSPKIKINVAPIEIFIEMSASKVADKKELFERIKNKLASWKKSENYNFPITITLEPVNWVFEVGL